MLPIRIIIFLFLASNFNLAAQIELPRSPKEKLNRFKINQSTLFTGGSSNFNAISFSELDNNINKRLAINFTPSLGVFIVKNLLFGVSFQYELERETSEDKNMNIPNFKNELTYKSSVLSLFTRYYIANGSFKPFVGMRFGVGRNTIDGIFVDNFGNPTGNNTLPVEYLSVGLSGGVSYFINSRISIDASFEYGKNATENNGSNFVYGTNFGFAFLFGQNRIHKIIKNK